MSIGNHRLRLGTAAFALGLSLAGANAAVASADSSADAGASQSDAGSGSGDSGASARPRGSASSAAASQTAPSSGRGVGRSKPKAAPKLEDAESPVRGRGAEVASADSTEPGLTRLTSSRSEPTAQTESQSIATAVSPAAAVIEQPVVATTVAKATAVTVPPDLLSNISDWIATWPASPIKSMVEGALLMARRSFFNRDPITNPVQTVTLSNGQIFGTLGAFDPEGDAIEYVVKQGPQYGTVTIDSLGAYVYTPGEGFTGTDSFVVDVDDLGNHFNLGRLFASGDLATISVVRNAALPSGSIVDNFSGAAGSLPDSSIWSNRPGHDGGVQVYTDSPSNIRLDGDGNLVIEALQTEDGFTSARIASQDLMHLQYGTMVARIKMPAGQGIWPSFWMLGEDYADVGWPGSGEIDIMELVNEGTTYHVTLHGPQVWPSGEVTDYFGGGDASGKVLGFKGSIEDLSADYHDYWMKWREDRIEIGVDGQLLAVFTPEDLPEGAVWKFNQPMFVVMQVAVGGTWAGLPDDTTEWPATMLVDSFQYTPYV